MAVIAQVRCAWKKFHELCFMLTREKMSLKLKGTVYAAYVRSSMVYGSETRATNVELQIRLERREMYGVIAGVFLRERETHDEL